MKWSPLIFAAVLLAGCQNIVAPSDPAQSVFALESTLTAAITLADQYAALPACGTGVTICSSHAIVVQINAAAQAADVAIMAAQAAVTNSAVSASAQQDAVLQATTAINALTALTSTLKVK